MAKTDSSIPVRKKAYLEAYGEAREAIEKEGFVPILMKSDGRFPYLNSNMDILVVGRDFRQCAGDALDRIAKRMAVEKGYLHLTHYSEPMKRLLRKRSRPIDKVIHLHGWVGWGSEEFIEVDDFVSGLREGRDVEDFFYPSPENIALLAISHALYENGCVSQNDVKKVISALTEMGGRDPAESGGRLLRIARKYGWQNGLSLFFVLLRRFGDAPEYQINTPGGNKRFIKFIERHSEKSKDRIVINRYAAKLLFFDKIFSTEMPAGRKIRSAADTVSRHMLPRLGYARQRPFVVALSGMDGSGKSFYRENLLRKLGDFDLKTGSMWARGGNTGFYLKIKSAVRKVLKPFAGGSGIVRTYERDGKVENPLLVNLWSVAVFLDVVYHYVLLLRIKKGTRRVVVSDRFVEDTFIDLMRRAGGGGGFIRTLFRIAKFLAPVPDRHVFLKVSPENAMKRKEQTFPIESLRERERLYDGILGEISHIVIDTDHVSGEDGVDAVLESVLDGYFD